MVRFNLFDKELHFLFEFFMTLGCVFLVGWIKFDFDNGGIFVRFEHFHKHCFALVVPFEVAMLLKFNFLKSSVMHENFAH